MMRDNVLVFNEDNQIQNMIHTIRGKQVIVDSDLAILYQVETKYLNRQRSRNVDRFPDDFCFQLTKDEYKNLRCQNVTSNFESGAGGRRYMPYVYTEQGIAMLASVLKSEIATTVSVYIMRTFVEMRRFLISNAAVFGRLDRVELKQLETDQKLEKVFNYIASQTEVKQNIFFGGQIYDAFSFIVDLIKKAKTKLILIDNYVDTNTLNLLCKKNMRVEVMIVTAGKGSLTTKDVTKFNAQYPNLTVKFMNNFHDRFLIIDDVEVYHIGASIKDAGKKSFGITKIEDNDLIQSLINKMR